MSRVRFSFGFSHFFEIAWLHQSHRILYVYHGEFLAGEVALICWIFFVGLLAACFSLVVLVVKNPWNWPQNISLRAFRITFVITSSTIQNSGKPRTAIVCFYTIQFHLKVTISSRSSGGKAVKRHVHGKRFSSCGFVKNLSQRRIVECHSEQSWN